MSLLVPSQAITSESVVNRAMSDPTSRGSRLNSNLSSIEGGVVPSTTTDATSRQTSASQNRRRRKPANKNNRNGPSISGDTTNAIENTADGNVNENVPKKGTDEIRNDHRRRRNRKNPQNRSNRPDNGTQEENIESSQNRNFKQGSTNSNNEYDNRKSVRNRNNRRKNDFWWKNYIPDESVDPITLDPLKSLRYPPFALVASVPYEPIPEWPIRESIEAQTSNVSDSDKQKGESAEERQRRILEEQWGSYAAIPKGKGIKQSDEDFDNSNTEDSDKEKFTQLASKNVDEEKTVPLHLRHVNLFDGQALAYYMVSQLQFIDPLNRRDLTRDEIVNLDRYLRRHGFGDKLNVTEAYDTKGITVSTAGAIGNTAAGRAAILQQEAQNLLNALFRGTSLAPSRQPAARRRQNQQPNNNYDNSLNNNYNNSQNNNYNNSLMQHYHAYENSIQHHDERQIQANEGHVSGEDEQDTGIYGGGGLMVIDDDLNPGLRGDVPIRDPTAQPLSNSADVPSTLWSANHIVARHQTRPLGDESEFPSLAATLPTGGTVSGEGRNEKPKKKLPASKTLAKIGNVVKKTDPEEAHRQWEARELARKKAMLSNLTFGSNPASWGTEQLLGTQLTVSDSTPTGPTEAQIERNRAFAEALGVKPATVRSSLTTGWARPTGADEFGNELMTTTYPDDLVLKAREHMTALLKLENKWITFLENDSAASLPLNKMEKALRALVHEYATYWRLHTESFDPEPKRYVHCVKLKDTRAPYPLLSNAARSWKGPQPKIISPAPVEKRLEHPTIQTAGQSTRGREMLSLPERTPLTLKPRSVVDLVEGMSGLTVENSKGNTYGGVSIGDAPKRTMTEAPIDPESRFGALTAGRERPKLELQPRTLPLESSQSTTTNFDVSEELVRARERAKAKAQREKEKEERKRRALEAVFASDDERSTNNAGTSSDNDDDDSVWDEPEAIYQGAEEEY